MKIKQAKLAIEGGPKAFPKMTGKIQPKVGVAEFLSIAERFAFKPAVLQRLRRTFKDSDLEGRGPHLGRYYGSKPIKGEEFEAIARKLFGVRYALGVSSGTAALHSAFIAAGVGPGTEVVCPALGFAATSMAVVLAGGVPVYCDVDESLHLDPRKLEDCITKRTVAVAPTHCWSAVADMAPILRIARKHGLKVIEDCAQAPGARYRGKYVGSIGDIGCFSISCYKIIGGGEGGMVVTNDERLFDRVRQFAEGGGLWRPDRFGPERYKGELFPGTNYRLSELESAINVVQLGKLDAVCDRYRRASRRIRRQLGTFREITPQVIHDEAGSIGYALRFFPATLELSRKIAAALAAEGVGAWTRGADHKPDWHLSRDMYPVTLRHGHIAGASVFEDPRYTARGGRAEYRAGQCPVAEELFGREVMVNVDQWLSASDCDAIARALNKVFRAYCTESPRGRPWITR
jgi:8-amino-3,8-dideoxy-alpha-D-manno-octulosonate transaminase